tara:strand:- start:330 stop:524 length:195 start_codon:yes stop_codon:yes gene_type:complete
MDLLLALGIPLIILLGFTLYLSNGNNGLKEKLFQFEMSGRSAQIWTFGVILLSTLSMIVYFSKK